jgi:GATA-binding protein
MVITQRSVSPPPSSSSILIVQQQPPPPPPPTKKKEPASTASASNEVSATICSNCGTTTTPLWRRAPNGETICNACGLYLKARNTLRPPSMKRNLKKQQAAAAAVAQLLLDQPQTGCSSSTANAPVGTCPGGGQCNGTGGSASCEGCPAFNQHQVNRHALICANCRTTTTPLWRRDEAGNTICNACGLYYKLHNVHRPVSMKRSVIKRRKRIIVSDNGEEQLVGEEEEEDDELESSDEEKNIDDDDDEEKVKEAVKKKKRRVVNKRKPPVAASQSPNSNKSNPAVPAIEDYIIPKRTSLASQQLRKQEQEQVQVQQYQRLPPPPRTPPLNPKIYHHSRQLPAISDIRPPAAVTSPPLNKRFDPLFDYRSTSNTPPVLNKHVGLPPIMSSSPNNHHYITQQQQQQQQQQHHNPYQHLSEFDNAMTRLERLRRRVPPEQSKVLSKLTLSLEEIVQQAENILLNSSSSTTHHNNSSNSNSISHHL